VQHVSVNEGGRAIVGNVTQDVPGSASQKSVAGSLALTDSRQQPMPTIEERRKGELVPGPAGKETMGKLGVKNRRSGRLVVMNMCRNPPSTPAR
jgi:hypothetical protein